MKTPEEWIKKVAKAIHEKKGENLIAIDVRGVSSVTDFVLIADGNVDRHVTALGREVETAMRDLGQKAAHIEGMQEGDWVVLDYFQVVVHLFLPEMREKYQLERLWPDGKVIDLDFEVEK